MEDKKLRKAFKHLCSHLNVKPILYYDYFGSEESILGYKHEAYYGDLPCKIARKEDIDALKARLDKLEKPKARKKK